MSKNGRGYWSKSDNLVTVFAIFAILLAGGISLGTMSQPEITQQPVADPVKLAEQAAYAGIEAARWHIECHGLKAGGALPRRFYVNGGRFEVAWDGLNQADSTVRVLSTGYYEIAGDSLEIENRVFCSMLETIIKIDCTAHPRSEILARHYQRATVSTSSQAALTR